MTAKDIANVTNVLMNTRTGALGSYAASVLTIAFVSSLKICDLYDSYCGSS